ncbi:MULTISPECIES: nucleotidyl transferase AbiEii/AbiGii toxin family protein [Gordonibacter]|uniref:Nucleotidyl transferase AbiEii/AbiGii toxin family protein n=1 Tax=Gordonibacter faecis TaxID=3047475 RepID=A0ABT7DNT5_9ACTN|nr:nucleotidyl transferase AbiEii/AbiGii toxin family protein [Gordonibacter sp. KGMB12511]MDJ1651199.1 nucleotidyl transferase AbiEii/AbiGii toxin family protein [Gordonibacter sp. KGMB12511]HIW77335.1 nucleotidyl transferase AbiEii/AbiGii toxin family protein [Candidatus Gordonibacter avicola]
MLKDMQRTLAHEALSVLSPYGFVLAGSGAIREHGLIERPTEDIDLFCAVTAEDNQFETAVTILTKHLEECGYHIREHQRSPHYYSAEVEREGVTLQFDMGIDYREYPPARLEVGPVLDVRDAVANKLGAMCSRGEPRDYLDADKIHTSGLFSDETLLNLTLDHDLGLTKSLFIECLRAVVTIEPEEVERYGYRTGDLAEVKVRLMNWANDLEQSGW